MAEEESLGLMAIAVTGWCLEKGGKCQEEEVSMHRRNPWPVLPALCADNALQRLLGQSASYFQQSFGLVAKGNLNKRNKAGYSVSNCHLHNFFLIAFSIDNLCQNEHSTNDAGKTVCQTLTPSECYYTDLVLGSVSGPRNSTDIQFRRQSNLIHLLLVLDLAESDSRVVLPLVTGPLSISECMPLECWIKC